MGRFRNRPICAITRVRVPNLFCLGRDELIALTVDVDDFY